ncbi:MAG: hypothetical protein HYZ29_05780 [Myxococcales bacterium]|nr:hypothetical protein [Myxococcales bacterium]
MSRSLAQRGLAATCTIIALSLPAPAGAETYTGADFTTLARQSIDVVRMQHYRLQGQMDRDQSEFFYEATLRWMPNTRFQLYDGRVVKAPLERLGGGYWWGEGHPRTGTAFFSAFQMDVGIAAAGSNSDAVIFDGLLLTGAAYHGLSVAVGVRGGFTAGMTGDGQFTDGGEVAVPYRPGAPGDAIPEGAGAKKEKLRFGGFVTSIQHAEGFSLGAVLDQTQVGSGELIAAVLAQVQPVALVERAGLRDVGVPGLGLNRISEEIDYYGDQLEATRARVEQGLPAPPRKLSAPLYEVPFVIDDLASIGLRVRAVTQVSPDPLFRLAELGYAYRGDIFRVGGRAVGFRRGDAFVGSGEAFAGYGVKGSAKSGGWALTGSYSYNVPDSVTFYSIPNASVYGFQLTVGPEELARPIVPLVARERSAK